MRVGPAAGPTSRRAARPLDAAGPRSHAGAAGRRAAAGRLLRGRPGQAFTYNPASPLLVAGAVLALVRWLVGRLTSRWLEVRVHPSPVAWGIGAVALLVLWGNQQAHAALLR